MKTRVGAVASALVLTSLLVSCGASGAEPTPTVTVTATVTAEPTGVDSVTSDSSAPAQVADGTVGEVVNNGGVDLTIKKASAVDTVSMTMDINSPKVTQEKPPAGGRYIRIDTVVENAGKKLDLTCMGPVQIVAIDSEEREFNTLESLYKIVDNPGCNDQLQPGFKDDMTWVFMVPEDAEITGVSFYDSQQSMYDQPSFIAFDKSL